MSLIHSLRHWQSITIGAIISVLVGTILVGSTAIVYTSGQEMGGVIVIMCVLCYWGATPAFIFPFVLFAIRRKPPARRILGAALAIGGSFPIALSIGVLFLPMFLRFLDMPGVAKRFEGGLVVDDASFWFALLPFALVMGTGLAHFTLGSRRMKTV